MRIYSSITVDMSTWQVLEATFENYEGPVALCKNDQAKTDAHNAAVTSNENAQAQLQFSQQLMTIFQSQYANQTAMLNFLKGKMEPMINNPTGYDAKTLAAMRTQATDTTATQYQNAQKALQNNPAMGSAGLPSGVRAQNEAALASAAAGQQANEQESITQADANLKQQNYWAAVNALNGNASQVNPLGYSGAATGAAGASSGAAGAAAEGANAETNAYNAGNSWMGVLGGVAGGIAGGVGKALGGQIFG